jgi:hypothetical protein
MSTPIELDAILQRTVEPTAHQYNLIAAALNEYFVLWGMSDELTAAVALVTGCGTGGIVDRRVVLRRSAVDTEELTPMLRC